MGAGPSAAAVLGTKQIVFAVMATTATLAAVFIPVSFMPGIVGSLFSEFGFVLAFSVTISAAVALTVCPMLAAKLGTGEEGHDDHGLIGRFGNAFVESLHGHRRDVSEASLAGRSACARISVRSAGSPSNRSSRKSRRRRIAASSRSVSPRSRAATSTTCRS